MKYIIVGVACNRNEGIRKKLVLLNCHNCDARESLKIKLLYAAAGYNIVICLRLLATYLTTHISTTYSSMKI